MKKSLLLTVIAFTACVSLALAGCAAKTAPDTKKAAAPTSIKITYVKSPLNIPSIDDKNNQTISNSFADSISLTNERKLTLGDGPYLL